MSRQRVFTPPVRQATRTNIFGIRLTDREQAEIEALAKHYRIPSSYMARHFILEAVAYHKISEQEELNIEFDH